MWECINCQEVLEEDFEICWKCATTREGLQPINFLEPAKPGKKALRNATSFQTEYEFTLPVGFVDEGGSLHREGTMRLAVAADEILPRKDPRVQANTAYFDVILLSRVVTKLGTLVEVTPKVVEALFALDFAYLKDFYKHINGNDKNTLKAVCPKCKNEFDIQPASAKQELLPLPQKVATKLKRLMSIKQNSKGKGLKMLFSGHGTNKFLAARVIALELGLKLQPVDLSAVVSKYINETEKNLERIFDKAESSNVMLFFDEADALFGKRTGIKDANDRYDNIETRYVLQRIEKYAGFVIFNVPDNKKIDQAFTRRFDVTLDFPVPGADEREDIWAGVFFDFRDDNP